MSDLSSISTLSDGAILKRIGQYVKSKRIERDLTQDNVAERAAISRSTLSLLERGENIAFSNLLKILRVLDALYVLEQFQVSDQISPIQIAKEDEKRRKRASRGTRGGDNNNNWEW